MADFETWKFSSLVQFAEDAQREIARLEDTVREMTQERADFITAIRKLIADAKETQ